MINLNDILGKPVILAQTGAVLGTVSSSVFKKTRARCCLSALVCFEDEGPLFKVPVSAVLSVGEDAIILKTDAGIEELFLEEDKAPLKQRIIGRGVFTLLGKRAGTVSDVGLNETAAFAVEAVEVKHNGHVKTHAADDFICGLDGGEAIVLKGNKKLPHLRVPKLSRSKKPELGMRGVGAAQKPDEVQRVRRLPLMYGEEDKAQDMLLGSKGAVLQNRSLGVKGSGLESEIAVKAIGSPPLLKAAPFSHLIGLPIKAALHDSKTGKPVLKKGELITAGALSAIVESPRIKDYIPVSVVLKK